MATADPGVGSWTPINMWAMIRALINNGCPIVTFSGPPTNGTSGTFAGQAGPGSLLIDYTTPNFYVNRGTLLSPLWISVSTLVSWQPLLAVNGPVPLVSGYYVVTKTSALADTIAAPNIDGLNLTITSDTAFAHIFTFTGGTLDTGTAAVTTATFNAFKGSSFQVISYNGRWKLVASNGVSFS